MSLKLQILNEIKKSDPKLSNFARAYRLTQRRIDKRDILAFKRGDKASKASAKDEPKLLGKADRSASKVSKINNKYDKKLLQIGTAEDANKSIRQLFKQTIRHNKGIGRSKKLTKKYGSLDSPKHKGLYMEWQNHLGNLILEGLSPEAKKYRVYATASKTMKKRKKELEPGVLKGDVKDRAEMGVLLRSLPRTKKTAKEHKNKLISKMSQDGTARKYRPLTK